MRLKNTNRKLNTTRIMEVDSSKSTDLTHASVKGCKQKRKVYKFLRDHVPGFENAKMMVAGSVIGIRESRHIESKYVILKEDVLNLRTFEDDILLCSNAIDIHPNDCDRGGEYIVIDKWYSIPYRSLLSPKYDNLLVAGRTISATSEAVSAFRIIPPCFGIGQAVGTGAAICIKGSIKPEEVAVKKLQKP